MRHLRKALTLFVFVLVFISVGLVLSSAEANRHRPNSRPPPEGSGATDAGDACVPEGGACSSDPQCCGFETVYVCFNNVCTNAG